MGHVESEVYLASPAVAAASAAAMIRKVSFVFMASVCWFTVQYYPEKRRAMVNAALRSVK